MTLTFNLIIKVFSFVFFNELEAFQISSTSSSTCAVTDEENKATRIICPSDSIISNIHFASYGNPEGVCGNYTVGSCHATQSVTIVMNECLNKNKCSIIPSNDVFDLPAVDACHNLVTKLLYVEVSCKASSNNVSISSITTDIIPTITPTFSCQVGWIYYNNNCYKFNVGYNSWSGCKSQCASLGASMLCIPDSTTNNWIANQIYQNGYSYSWIGYSDLPNNDGNYEWVSGCSSSYSNSVYGNNYYYYDCVYIYAYSGAWYRYDCSYYDSCSCEYSFAPTSFPTLSPTSPTINPTPIPTTRPSLPPPTISPTVGCQLGWSYYNSNCYKFNVGTYFSWSGCKSVCASLGASMLCIPDSATNSWIANQLYSQQGYYSYSWIGYSDLPNNDGNYEWVSGCSSSYSKSGYSNNYYYYDCVYISAYSGVWYSSSDSGDSSIACSCQYSIAPTSLPTLLPTSPTFNPTLIPTISPNAGCKSGWIHYNNNCYKFNVGTYLSWSGCKSQCASLGASMLCIPDSTTNTWIANQLYSQLGYYSYSWIGYSDLPNNDGNYEWVSGCSSSYSNSGYSNYYSDCVYISAYSGAWSSSSDSNSYYCSCQSLPTPLPSTRSNDNTSAIIGIVVGCVVFAIIVIIVLIYFFCKRTNQVCISTINESPSNNDNISSSDQAYTDIPPICSSPDDDDDDDNDDNDGVVPISSSTIELQVIVASDAYYNDVVPMDHELELLPVAVQV